MRKIKVKWVYFQTVTYENYECCRSNRCNWRLPHRNYSPRTSAQWLSQPQDVPLNYTPGYMWCTKEVYQCLHWESRKHARCTCVNQLFGISAGRKSSAVRREASHFGGFCIPSENLAVSSISWYWQTNTYRKTVQQTSESNAHHYRACFRPAKESVQTTAVHSLCRATICNKHRICGMCSA